MAAKAPRNRPAEVALMLRPAAGVNRQRVRSIFGDGILVLFLIAQLLDGVFTYVGIATFGESIEANPLIAWYIAMFGPGVALIGAKTFAVACAATLHFCERHRTVGVLTIIYLAVAIWPWMLIIWS
jgi:uncharacterized membrane protein